MEVKKKLTQIKERRGTIKHQLNCINIRQRLEGRKVTRSEEVHLKILITLIYHEDLIILNLQNIILKLTSKNTALKHSNNGTYRVKINLKTHRVGDCSITSFRK